MPNIVGESANSSVPAVSGKHTTNGKGVSASSEQGIAVEAVATKDTAVFAHTDSGRGVDARSKTGRALHASSEQGVAVEAVATKDTAVFAHTDSGRGVDARSKTGRALYASSEQGVAVEAVATKDTAVFAHSTSGIGIDARSETGYAGIFTGDVLVTGDIQLQNADCAEDFPVADPTQAAPGTVMVLTNDGSLRPCAVAYDKKVVGVVAGAGSYRPGIVFDRSQAPTNQRVPISVMGKVACRADAAHGEISIGDLLTTSPTIGCAMKASDPNQRHGSIIGKALSSLKEGEGLVNMLIALY